MMMQKLYLYLFVFIGFGMLSYCSDNNAGCENIRELKIPPFLKKNSDGWENYSVPIILTTDTVKGYAPGTGSPEAPVIHFYASKIRGDHCFKQVLFSKREDLLNRKLKQMQNWKYIEIRLIKRKKVAETKFWINIFMKLEIDGKIDSGSDEVSVEKIDGAWYIRNLPT